MTSRADDKKPPPPHCVHPGVWAWSSKCEGCRKHRYRPTSQIRRCAAVAHQTIEWLFLIFSAVAAVGSLVRCLRKRALLSGVPESP